MRRPTTLISLLLALMCLSWITSPSMAARPWYPAYHQEKTMRRDLLRQQHRANRDQLLYQLRSTHPSDVVQRRAIHEHLRQEARCYGQQLRGVARDDRELRRAYQYGYRESMSPVAITTSGPRRGGTPVSPTAALPLTGPVVPTASSATVPRNAPAPAEIKNTVLAAPPAASSTADNRGPVRSVVVPASHLESLPPPTRTDQPTPTRPPKTTR